MLDIVLSCIGLYGLLAGFFLLTRKDRIWDFQQRRAMGIRSNTSRRTAEWDAQINKVGLAALLLGLALLLYAIIA